MLVTGGPPIFGSGGMHIASTSSRRSSSIYAYARFRQSRRSALSLR